MFIASVLVGELIILDGMWLQFLWCGLNKHASLKFQALQNSSPFFLPLSHTKDSLWFKICSSQNLWFARFPVLGKTMKGVMPTEILCGAKKQPIMNVVNIPCLDITMNVH